jgi:hypothetical protein
MDAGSTLLLNSPHQSLFVTAGQWVYAEEPELVVNIDTVGGKRRHRSGRAEK